MHSEQLTQFRNQLIDIRNELIGTLATTTNDIKPVALDQNAVGRVSRVDAMQMQQMALESFRRRERQLINVEKAIKRTEKNSFGICIDCDEDINVRRLEIDPTAIRCIKCAEEIAK
ncbi:MAG: TraR/DksA family transcriptional regulator [Gammaproteobacteria bacterium]|nr:MAG: TraR/DksA family transcriptional regulator [Gammaproteobacteria bacterium]